MRAPIRTLIVMLLTVGLVGLFLRNADLSQVWQSMRGARVGLLLAGVGLTLASYPLRARRWQYLLEPLGHARFGVAFRTTVIGFAASSVLPARAGEVLRPYLLARLEGISATATFATIIVERLLDLLAVLMLLAAYLVFFDPGMAARDSTLFGAVRLGGLVVAPVTVLGLAVMYVLAGHPDWLRAALAVADRRLPARLATMLARVSRMFADGFGVLRRPRRVAASVAWSLVMWLVICAETWVVALACGLDMPFAGAWLMMALLVVGVSLPTPGGVGGFHEAFRLGATAFFGADNDAAIAAAILLHAISYVPVTILGLYYAAREGLDLRGAGRLAAAPAEVKA